MLLALCQAALLYRPVLKGNAVHVTVRKDIGQIKWYFNITNALCARIRGQRPVRQAPAAWGFPLGELIKEQALLEKGPWRRQVGGQEPRLERWGGVNLKLQLS